MSYTTQRQPSTKIINHQTKTKSYKSLLANRNMYTFMNAINNNLAYEQIMAFTENFKHSPLKKASALQEELRNTLPQETTFGYVMYNENQLTDAEIINAMRYNDSKDTHFTHFTVWYEVVFVFLDFHAKQIMCWGTKPNVQDALEGIQELLNNAINKKEQRQNEELKKVQDEQKKRVNEQKRVDMQNEEKHFYDKVDRTDCWDKEYMANKHS